MNLPIELKTRIYDHIGTVQKHLDAFPPDEQREILQSLETHIHDALEARSEGTPEMSLLEAILAEMDPPESYGPDRAPVDLPDRNPGARQPEKTGQMKGAKGCGCAAAVMGFLLFLLIISSVFFYSRAASEVPDIRKGIPSVVGKWTAIDFVSSVSEFSPKRMYNVGGLELKGLEFLPDGKTDKPWWSWKENQLFHSGDQSEAELMIVTVNQTEYLFMEWISGDVLIHKEKPNYYVFKRGAYIDPSPLKTIQEGVGWNTLRIGATRAELIAEFGPPDSLNSMVMSWSDRDIACHLGGGDNSALHKAVQLNFGSGFSGATSKGIHMGSTEEEVLAAYGNPERISKSASHKIRGSSNITMTWLKLGIQLTLNESSGVTQIDIIKRH